MSNDSFRISLINEVKKYPQLYDSIQFHPGTSVTQLKVASAWSKISETLNESSEICMKKWQVIRGSYQRYLRNKDFAKVPYYLSAHMDFLLPMYQHKYNMQNELKNQMYNNDDDSDPDFNNDDDDDFNLENNFLITENDEIEKSSSLPFESLSIEIQPINNKIINNIKLNSPYSSSDLSFCIKLLKEIKKYPELHEDYRTPHHMIWEKIAENIGESKEVCTTKWQEIKTSYQRYLKQIDTATVPYYLSEYMKFMLPHFGPKFLPKSHHYLINESLLEQSDESDYSLDHFDDDQIENNILEGTENFDLKNKRKFSIFESNDDLINNKIIKIEKITENHDEDEMFWKSLLPKMSLLNRNKKIVFRISVLNLLKDLTKDVEIN